MSDNKSIKEFAEELNMDKKQLQNKLTYWKKKGSDVWDFSDTFSEGVRILTKAEQIRVCELLGVPVFRQNSDSFKNPDLRVLEMKIEGQDKLIEMLQTQLDKQNQANDELRILLQNSLKQLSEKVSELSVSENAEQIGNKEIVDVFEGSEKSSEKEKLSEEELFYKMNPDYKGYWNELFREIKKSKRIKIPLRRASRLSQTMKEIKRKQ